MKAGFNLLLWTTHVTKKHRPLLEKLKQAGYDGVEIPVFEGEPIYYSDLGKVLDEMQLERTIVSVVPTPDKNPISADASVREAGVAYLKWLIDCSQALGSPLLCGPLHSTLGQFSGMGPTKQERKRAISVTGKRATMLPRKVFESRSKRSIDLKAIS